MGVHIRYKAQSFKYIIYSVTLQGTCSQNGMEACEDRQACSSHLQIVAWICFYHTRKREWEGWSPCGSCGFLYMPSTLNSTMLCTCEWMPACHLSQGFVAFIRHLDSDLIHTRTSLCLFIIILLKLF